MKHAFFVTLLAGIPTLLCAQTATHDIDDVRRDARLHAGPFYVSPRIQLKELGVDTNVFNQAGEQQSDFTFTLTPNADVWVPFSRRALIKAAVASDLVWYRKFESERSIDPQLSARAELYLGRLTLFTEGAYVSSRQRPNFEIDVRSRHSQHTVVAGAEYRVTSKLFLEFSRRRGELEFDGDTFFLGTSLEETLNRTTMGSSATVRYRATPLTSFVLRGEQFGDEFPLSPQRDTESARVMPGVEFKPRALVSGSAFVGVRRLRPNDGAMFPGYTGMVAQLGLSYTLLASTTFGVSYDRDVNYSFEPLQPYFILSSIGGSVRRALGSRFDVIASMDRHTYAYRDLFSALQSDTRPDDRVDITWNYASSVGYRPRRDLRIGLGASFYRRASTTKTFRNYEGLRLITTATYGF